MGKQRKAGKGRMRWLEARRAGAVLSTVFFGSCLVLFIVRSRHWPLVNDAALMHYVVLLMGRGMAPYRDIGDYNLPGAYGPEWLSMSLAKLLHLPGAAMWRVMDAWAMVLGLWAAVRIARPGSWFAGVWAGSLLALYHGRDGVGQAGQRDLWVTVLLLWGVAFLLGALRQERQGRWDGGRRPRACFGLLAGCAIAIKPVALPFLLLGVVGAVARGRGRRLIAVLAGLLLPLLATAVFVLDWEAWGAFWHGLSVDLPYHAGLGDSPPWQLLLLSVEGSLGWLLAAAVLTTLLFRFVPGKEPRHELAGTRDENRERWLLGACMVLGCVYFVAQGKGYPYQRLPLAAFVFVLAAMQFAAAVRSFRIPLRMAGAAGFSCGVVLCAPSYLHAAVEARWFTPVTQAMEQALEKEAGPAPVASLDGAVQCLDVASGCTDALLHLQLRQATGTMYDELLFPQTPAPWGRPYAGPAPGASLPQAVEDGQRQFRAELAAHPPRIFLVTPWLFPEGPGGYGKLGLWPWLETYLRQHYQLVSQQDWERGQNGPLGFRMYVRR